MPISAVSSSEAERDAWKRAAELAGLPFTAWCRDALNAAAEAEQEARDQEGQFLPRTPSRAGVGTEPLAYVPPKLPLLPRGHGSAPPARAGGQLHPVGRHGVARRWVGSA